MEQGDPSHLSGEIQSHVEAAPEAEPKFHRQLSIDSQSRHVKSLSLPYATSPIHGPVESGSDDDDVNDEEYYSSEEEEDMFFKSLPADLFFNEFSGRDSSTGREDRYAVETHPVPVGQVTEDMGFGPAASAESTGDQKQTDVEDTEVNDGWEENEHPRTEDNDNFDQERSSLGNRSLRWVLLPLETSRNALLVMLVYSCLLLKISVFFFFLSLF